MFFKKNKPEASPDQEHQAIAPAGQPSQGQSLFAPGLNINATQQIDFGFNQFANASEHASLPTPSAGGYDPWTQPQGIQPLGMPSHEMLPQYMPSPVAEPLQAQTLPPLSDIQQPSQLPDYMPDQLPEWMTPELVPIESLPPIVEASSNSLPVAPMETQWSAPTEHTLSSDFPVLPPTSPHFEPAQAVESYQAPPVQPMMPTEALTPEQAWAMLQPSTPPMPLMPDEASDFALSDYTSPSRAGTALPENTSDHDLGWGTAFGIPENPGSAIGEPQEQFSAVQFPGSQEPSIQSPPGRGETWEVSDFNMQTSSFAESYSSAGLDFESVAPVQQPSFDEFIPPPQGEAAPNVAPITPDNSFSPQSDQTFEHQTFEAAQPQEAAGWGDIYGPASQALSNFEDVASGSTSGSSPLDAFWGDSLGEIGDLHSQFSSPEPGVTEQPSANMQPWSITGQHLGLGELSPEFSPPQQPMDQNLPAFDPVQASQELAVGWPQLENSPLGSQDAITGWQSEPETQHTSWEDESLSSLSMTGNWADNPGIPADPVYFHEAPASPQAEEQLWNNLSAPETAPGEQVPYTSGAMMDAINSQLYPEDPFPSETDEFSAGEQAFAEAARYLFPETVHTPLEWEDGSLGAPEQSISDLYGEEEEDVSILNLGPSYSTPNDATLYEFPGTPAAPLTSYPGAASPEAFSGTAYQLSDSELAPYPYESALEEPVSPVQPGLMGYNPAPGVAQTPKPQAWLGSLAPEPSASLESAYSDFSQMEQSHEAQSSLTPGAEWGMPAEAAAIWTPDTVSTSTGTSSTMMDDAALGSISQGLDWQTTVESDIGAISDFTETLGGSAAQLGIPVSNRVEPSTPEARRSGLGPEIDLSGPTTPMSQAWDASSGYGSWQAEELTGPQAQSLNMAEANQPSGAYAALEDETDFYATAFTVNELGEVVPLHEEEILAASVPQQVKGEAAQNMSVMPVPLNQTGPDWQQGQTVGHTGYPQQVDLTPPEMPLMPPVSPLGGPSGSPGMISPVGPKAAFPQGQVPQPAQAAPELPAMPVFSPEQFLATARQRFAPSSAGMPAQPAMPPTPAAPAAQPVDMQAAVPPISAPMAPPEQAPVVKPAADNIFKAPPVTDSSTQATVPEESKIIRPKPLTRKPAVIPPPEQQQEQGHLESQWYSPEPVSSLAGPPQEPLPSTADIEMKLKLGNLEVLGLCQLSPDKRLLVVQHDGIFALMTQCGEAQPTVSVLKVFEHNPLAYQHTFTAVQEAKSIGQGMYLTQVGTWRAILSTFQDTISLHTELG